MNIIDNKDVLDYRSLGDDRTFLPGLAFTFTNATKVLAFTENGSVPAGDTFKRANIEVFDKHGDKKAASISAEDGTVSIDLDAAPALDLTGEINIKCATATLKNLTKDGGFYGLLPIADAAGTLSFEK